HARHGRKGLAADVVFDGEVVDGEQRGHVSGCQQANSAPAPSGSSSRGLVFSHTESAYLQRGANEQPGNGRVGSGGRPPIAGSGVCGALSSLGIAASNASVYGMRMCLKRRGVGARWARRPADNTAASSVRPATTPRSCVIRIIAM